MINEDIRSKIISIAAGFVAQGVGPEHDRPCYLQLTEGRADWTGSDGEVRHYGWCGDYITYVLSRVGVMDGSILNRAELNDGKWTPGDNLARVQRWAKLTGSIIELDAVRDDPALLLPGDIVIFIRPDGDHIAFWEEWLAAGSFSSLDGNSYGRICKRNGRQLVPGANQMPIRHFIRITDMPLNSTGIADSGDLLKNFASDIIAMGGDSSELWTT